KRRPWSEGVMLQIPALEWMPLAIIGDTTDTSPIITGIADTTGVEAGMVVYGTDIPYNSRVVSTTVDSITISNDATGSTVAASLTIYKRFDFTYPPSVDNGEQAKVNQSVSKSLSGRLQVVT